MDPPPLPALPGAMDRALVRLSHGIPGALHNLPTPSFGSVGHGVGPWQCSPPALNEALCFHTLSLSLPVRICNAWSSCRTACGSSLGTHSPAAILWPSLMFDTIAVSCLGQLTVALCCPQPGEMRVWPGYSSTALLRQPQRTPWLACLLAVWCTSPVPLLLHYPPYVLPLDSAPLLLSPLPLSSAWTLLPFLFSAGVSSLGVGAKVRGLYGMQFGHTPHIHSALLPFGVSLLRTECMQISPSPGIPCVLSVMRSNSCVSVLNVLHSHSHMFRGFPPLPAHAMLYPVLQLQQVPSLSRNVLINEGGELQDLPTKNLGKPRDPELSHPQRGEGGEGVVQPTTHPPTHPATKAVHKTRALDQFSGFSEILLHKSSLFSVVTV